MVIANLPEHQHRYRMIDPISRFLHRGAGRQGPVILMYHSVLPGRGIPDWPWAVSLQCFRSQLDFFAAEGWATPTVTDLVSAPEKYTSRTAVITFDDGYADNLVAWDELQERGMRATCFVVSGSIGREPAWPFDGHRSGRLLNSAELRGLQSAGMEIGSHTVNHVRLTQVDEGRRLDELFESKAKIEDILGNTVSSFAYPYGAWDPVCAKAVRDTGYDSACTNRSGWALRDSDRYQLRRLTVFNNDTVSSLARKLSLGDNNVNWHQILRYTSRRLAQRLGR